VLSSRDEQNHSLLSMSTGHERHKIHDNTHILERTLPVPDERKRTRGRSLDWMGSASFSVVALWAGRADVMAMLPKPSVAHTSGTLARWPPIAYRVAEARKRGHALPFQVPLFDSKPCRGAEGRSGSRPYATMER